VRRRFASLGAADWLALAAAPTFALMAALTTLGVVGHAVPLCGEMSPSPLSGMGSMYLLMSAFHLAPWLRLTSGPTSSPVGP
jgi:hypothetical protein